MSVARMMTLFPSSSPSSHFPCRSISSSTCYSTCKQCPPCFLVTCSSVHLSIYLFTHLSNLFSADCHGKREGGASAVASAHIHTHIHAHTDIDVKDIQPIPPYHNHIISRSANDAVRGLVRLPIARSFPPSPATWVLENALQLCGRVDGYLCFPTWILRLLFNHDYPQVPCPITPLLFYPGYGVHSC